MKRLFFPFRQFFDRHPLKAWAVVFVVMMALGTYTMFFPIIPNLLINVLPPFLLLLFTRNDFFVTLKMVTLIFGRILIAFTALGYIDGQVMFTLVVLFLTFNILEVMIFDFKTGWLFNFLSGAALLVSFYYLQGCWKDDTYIFISSTNFLLVIMAYFFWQCNFTFHRFSQQIGLYHAFLQLLPLTFILIAWEPGYWLAFRPMTLLYGAFLQLYALKQVEKNFTSRGLERFNAVLKRWPAQLALVIVNVGLIAVFILSTGNNPIFCH